MSERSWRAAIGSLVALAVLATLGGCVAIPRSGPVTAGVSLAGGTADAGVEYDPVGPEAGATQLEIMQGFVNAFSSSTGGYAVAKRFLTDDFAAKWDPRQSVSVRKGVPRSSQIDASTIDYAFDTVATVDATGAYTESSAPTTLEFKFAKQAGQWRISAAPNGIVLNQTVFDTTFRQYAVYFADATGERLIPDARWFPFGTAASRIVSALFAGPSPWLKGAAITGFPDGTQLSDSSGVVTVTSNVANVDLSSEAGAPSVTQGQRNLMHLQLLDSLLSVPSISGVNVSVEGTPLQVDETSDVQPDPKVDGQALVLRKGQFGFYANGKIATISQVSTKVQQLKPTAATISSDQATVAVLSGHDVVWTVHRGSADSVAIDSRPGLIAPSMDEYGYVWSVPGSSPNAIQAFDSSSSSVVAHAVTSSPALPADSSIVSLEISRDGARVVILLATATGPRLIVAAILRDNKGVPTSLGPPIVDSPIDADLAVDATWVDQLSVAALVTKDGESSVQEFAIGGKEQSLGTLPPARALIGGNGENGLRALGGDSTVLEYGGSSWQSTKVKVDFIATQR